MRIGIYNRYWSTRGGAERYAGVIAEILSRDHEVELLGCDEVDLEELGEHLGLDLSRTHLRAVAPVIERDLASLTAEYELFINCTFLSKLPSKAEKSVYVVLFPHKVLPSGIVSGVRSVAESLSSWQPRVVPLEGFYETDMRGACWSRANPRFRVEPWAFQQGRARVRFGSTMPWPLAEAIQDVRAPGFEWRVEGNELVLDRRDSHPGPLQVELTCRTFAPAEWGFSTDERDLGVYLAAGRAFKPLAVLQRFAERVSSRMDGYDREIPTRYDLLVAISEFTRTWVSKRWGHPSEVLEPPVDTGTFVAPPPGEKKRIILSVGRFFKGSHNKKHLELLKVFRGMVDRGEVPLGWEYRLVGNLHRNRRIHLDYFAELERLAEGYPVKLLIDLPFDRLVEEYRRASIFWHAAGWGESESRRPDKLEHFGITTCEAMSSGCIPVVIARAGQLEIVEHGKNGFLFTSADELAGMTRRLIRGHGNSWTRELRERATETVKRFGRAEFEKRFRDILISYDLLRS